MSISGVPSSSSPPPPLTPASASSLADKLAIDYDADTEALKMAIKALPPHDLFLLATTKLKDTDSDAKKAVVGLARNHLSDKYGLELKSQGPSTANAFDKLAAGDPLGKSEFEILSGATAKLKSTSTTAQTPDTADIG